MTTPYNFTQFLYSPSSLLEDNASGYHVVPSGEFPISGEVVFHTRVNPGFSGDLRTLQLGLKFGVKFETVAPPSYAYNGVGPDDMLIRNQIRSTDPEASYLVVLEYYYQPSPITRRMQCWINGDYQGYLTPSGDYFDDWTELGDGFGIYCRWLNFSLHTTGDRWEFTLTAQQINYEWFAKSSGETTWNSLGEVGERSMVCSADSQAFSSASFASSPTVSVIEIENTSDFPKVPIDVKLQLTSSSGVSGELAIKFEQDSGFFINITGDA